MRRAYSEQKRAEVALVRAQKMEAVGKLTGGLAHDFNNLLTVIIGNLVGLRDRRCSGPTEFIDPALNAAKRGAILIQRLLAFARQQPLAEEIVNVPKAKSTILCRCCGEWFRKPLKFSSRATLRMGTCVSIQINWTMRFSILSSMHEMRCRMVAASLKAAKPDQLNSTKLRRFRFQPADSYNFN